MKIFHRLIAGMVLVIVYLVLLMLFEVHTSHLNRSESEAVIYLLMAYLVFMIPMESLMAGWLCLILFFLLARTLCS